MPVVRQTGLVDARMRWVGDLVPQHEQHWFDLYGSVARAGKPIRFENVAEGLGRWYDVHALRDGEPEQNRVAVLFSDITQRRRAENGLRELTQKLEQ